MVPAPLDDACALAAPWQRKRTGMAPDPVRVVLPSRRLADLRRGVAAAAAFGLAALGAVLFLDADEAQAAAMLADDARTLDAFREAAEELIKALAFAKFYPHVSAITSSRHAS